MKGTRLDKSADIRTIRRLYQDGLLNDEAFIAASGVLRPISRWVSWVRQMLLFFGSTLVLAGIIFFFAYNWAAMGRFFKFGMIEAGIIVCIIVSYLRGRTRLSGKSLLLGASVLVGVLLAVYGQTYQTGADAFELFLVWAVLISGWVVVSEFAGLWVVWLCLLNTTAILYWNQVGRPAHSIRYEYLCLAVAILNGLALAFREAGVLRGLEWLRGRWLRGTLLAAFLVAMSMPTINLIVDFKSTKGITVFVAFAWVIAIAGGYACYRHKLRDMVSLALIVTNICILILTLIGKVLFQNTMFDKGALFLLFALIIIGVVSGAAFWLRETATTMAKEMEALAE